MVPVLRAADSSANYPRRAGPGRADHEGCAHPMTTTTAASRPNLVTAPAVVAAVAYLVGLSWAMQHSTYDVWGGMIVLPVLLTVTLVLVTRGARREGDVRMVNILAAAVVVKLVGGTLVRYALIYEVYGTGDAQGYNGAGRIIAASLRDGYFPAELGGGGEGTQALNLITGLVYTVIGPTRLGGFFVFSWFAFLGLFLFYLAYRLAFPQGKYHRYAKLLFFLPTLVVWPSSIGKEAWLMLGLGLSVYGAARIFTRCQGGFVILGLGLAAVIVVRPHMAVLVFLGLALGYLLRPSRGRHAIASRVVAGGKALGVVTLAVAGFFVVGAFQEYFDLQNLDRTAVNELLESTSDRSASGGSAYEPLNVVDNPLTFPLAVVTVLFRPFPFEAHNAQALASSLEGALLLGLFVMAASRVVVGLRRSWRSPYIALCVTYSLLFIVAFSAMGNFGILARQRSLVYPFVIVLLTLPLGRKSATQELDEPPGRALPSPRVALDV